MSNDINATTVVEAQMYFAVIPDWVLELPISASSVRVYCCLRRYADNKTGQCWPSRRSLAMRAQCSIATLDRAIKELAQHGALHIAKRKNSAGDWTSKVLYVLELKRTSDQRQDYRKRGESRTRAHHYVLIKVSKK
jgi:hypothetical protein